MNHEKSIRNSLKFTEAKGSFLGDTKNGRAGTLPTRPD